MKIISFITTSQDQLTRRILDHLAVSTVVPRAHGPPEPDDHWPTPDTDW